MVQAVDAVHRVVLPVHRTLIRTARRLEELVPRRLDMPDHTGISTGFRWEEGTTSEL